SGRPCRPCADSAWQGRCGRSATAPPAGGPTASRSRRGRSRGGGSCALLFDVYGTVKQRIGGVSPRASAIWGQALYLVESQANGPRSSGQDRLVASNHRTARLPPQRDSGFLPTGEEAPRAGRQWGRGKSAGGRAQRVRTS